MNNTKSAVGSAHKDRTASVGRVLPLRRIARTVMYSYALGLLLVLTVQVVCIFLDWRPSQAWVSFLSRFFTSPAIAGLMAVVAAILGGISLKNQLEHTKEKAEYDAWWQQFEWVTDRIIPSSEEPVLLPTSLSFALMGSLKKPANTLFQQDAVEGIIDNYLKDVQEGTPSSAGPKMDEAGEMALRNLAALLPESSPSSERARQVLNSYAYERDVMQALRHLFGDQVSFDIKGPMRPDAIIEINSQQIIVEARLPIVNSKKLDEAVRNMQRVMEARGATHGVIITQRKPEKEESHSPVPEGIDVIEWDPSELSPALRSKLAPTTSKTKR